ncbi:MAG: hypothetical protein U9N53_08370 [Bacteroidota bacterium]|nr:hypothetical protein [Bacteroidota bacterium]
MKKPVNLILLFIIISNFTISCGEGGDEDLCTLDKEPLIERAFSFSTIVQYKNAEPYQGDISIVVFKEYCNDDISGKYELEGKGDEDGFWRPGYQFVYKFENTFDRVTVQFMVINIKTEQREQAYEIFDYLDVKGQYFGIEKTYYITLPWNAEDE